MPAATLDAGARLPQISQWVAAVCAIAPCDDEPSGCFIERYPGWARLLLLIPFVAVLWVPFYNSVEPSLLGIPFFYWYQMLWTILGALCIVPVYLYQERRRK